MVPFWHPYDPNVYTSNTEPTQKWLCRFAFPLHKGQAILELRLAHKALLDSPFHSHSHCRERELRKAVMGVTVRAVIEVTGMRNM